MTTIVATIIGIDKAAGTVTLQGPTDRATTIKARDPRNLDRVAVGDLVEIISLPEHWFVTLAPELKLNFKQDGAVFLPFDITVGKLLTRTIVASVEFKHKHVDAFKQFDWSVEARLGFFF